jgi:hypothetical protein
MRTRAIVPALALAALAGLGIVGCSKQMNNIIIANQPPTVRLTWAPVDLTDKAFYVYQMKWVGYDTDGRVARFEYVVDPPTATGADIWKNATITTKNEETIKFKAVDPDSDFLADRTKKPESRGFHVFVIRAVDNRGAVSEPISRAFNCFGVAPEVRITSPAPSRLFTQIVTPAVHIAWEGKDWTDATGQTYEKPLKYKYKLFKKNDPGVYWDKWREDPDSLRRQFAPDFPGWDSTGPDTSEVQFLNLTTKNDYLFAIVAISVIKPDRPYGSGAYSPIFSYDSNLLRMYVTLAGELGPIITIFNSFFSYTYPSGGTSQDPSKAIPVQVPAGNPNPHMQDGVLLPADPPITFNWTAKPPSGSIMKRYRWVLDLQSLDDETPRTSQNDWYHWSPWSLNETSAKIGPFMGAEGDSGEVHDFYLEAEDVNGLRSLGWVKFRVFRPSFDKDLLVVNDTRFMVDQKSTRQPPGRTDSLQAPYGTWPTRAELDTFLFAVGGVRWKMTPPGTLSPAGVFSGYSYDTLGTRYGRENPTVSLGLLGHYRHLVWMTDQKAVDWFQKPPNDLSNPQSTLFYMSVTNRQNTLATWVNQGGEVWGLGGGFGHATNAPWNNTANDNNQTRCYRYDGTLPDLRAGRFMFDLAHWRSEFRVFGPVFVRYARYDQPDPTIGYPRPPDYWRGGTFTNPDVDYTVLPTTLQFRAPATDPIWPYRSMGDFYVGNAQYSQNGINLEFLSLENYIIEEAPVPSNPELVTEVSKLDSIYLAYGSAYPLQMLQSGRGEGVNTVMTYYHGRENTPMVFTGMAIWDFRRQDCVRLVDFVLNKLWGLSKSTLYTAPRAVAPSLNRQVAVPVTQTLQQQPGALRRRTGTSTFQRWR